MVAVLVSILVSARVYPWVSVRQKKAGLLKVNYRGKEITPSLGVSLVFSYMAAAAVLNLAGEVPGLLLILLGGLGMSLVGLMDDLYEERVSGYKGHLHSWLNGSLTSGMFKALLGLVLGFLVASYAAVSPGEVFVGVLLFVFWSNGLNQLDRRPGRSLKVFLFLSVLLAMLSAEREAARTLLPLMASSLYLLPADLEEEAMLGDAGSNMLGAFLGTGALLILPWELRLWWLAGGVALNAVGEFYSWTSIIENNRVLRFLDSLGRRRAWH